MSGMWTGSIVSVDCGDVLGVFEGEISNVDGLNQTISLINVSRNSQKCQVPEVTLSTLDIKHLKLIESTAKPIHLEGKSAFVSPKKTAGVTTSPVVGNSQQKKGDGKKKMNKKAENRKWQKERDEACFNTTFDDSEKFDTDFDFEKNLALFDKKAVFEEINAHSRSDHVKLVDCNKNQAKYRHDENILNNDVPILKQISVPCHSDVEYVTDCGLVVPSVTLEFKKRLYKKAEEAGLTSQVRIEMVGRAAAEMVLQLVGGCHRLTPQNTHQRPTVVILCGPHVQGAQGINCGRHLANHCVNVSILTPTKPLEYQSEMYREMKIFKLSGGTAVHQVSALPATVDIILDALEPHEESSKIDDPHWIRNTMAWTKQSKAPVLGLDPPPDYSSSELKFILSPVLPFAFKNDKCSIHICDIGLPKNVFSSAGVCSYSSPFGSKFVISLHRRYESC